MTGGHQHRNRRLRIGVDLDNTIVCYDHLFHTLAVEKKLISPDIVASKAAVRDYLRAKGMEDSWTSLQACAYGPAMEHAPAFPGVMTFFRACARFEVDVFIVSHRTRRPYAGPGYDLHASAYAWLETHEFFDPRQIGLPREHVFLETTRTAKLQRIAELKCSYFIDDLPELLADADFPTDTIGLLFDPGRGCAVCAGFERVTSWEEAVQLTLGPEGKQH